MPPEIKHALTMLRQWFYISYVIYAVLVVTSSLFQFSSSPPVGVVGVGEVEREWGKRTNLQGLLSSLCLFSDHLSPSSVKTLHLKGGWVHVGGCGWGVWLLDGCGLGLFLISRGVATVGGCGHGSRGGCG